MLKKINLLIGVLERLQRFWFMGDCKRQDQEKEVSSNPLEIKHVSSTFIMLLIGTATRGKAFVHITYVTFCIEEISWQYYVLRYITDCNCEGLSRV